MGLVLGIADGLGISASQRAAQPDVPLPGEIYLHALALDAGLFVALGLALGLLWWIVPFSLAPSHLLARLVHRLRLRGGLAGPAAANAWAGLATAALGGAGTLLLAHHFLTAYQNRLLAAVALTAALAGWLAVLWGTLRTAKHYLTLPLTRVLARLPAAVWLLGPRTPWLLGFAAALGAALWLPRRFPETWDALSLARPAWFLGASLALLCATDALLRLRGAARVAVPAVALIAALGLGSTSVAAFGNARRDRRMARAIYEHGLLSGVVLAPVSQLADGDEDGYPDHFGGGDCDDDDPGIHPGAREIPDNGVDENCLGGDLHMTPELHRAVHPRPPRQPPTARSLRRRWNLVLVIVDTLRADRVGWAGSARPLTPSLDRLATRSQRFLRAYAPSNKTPSSLPALLSGRFTSELHRTFSHFTALYPSNVLLAERFQGAGFETLASVSHFSLRPGYGLAQGFRRWEVTDAPTSERMQRLVTSPQVTDRAIGLLRDWETSHGPTAPAAARRPFLLLLHYIDPHMLYLAHAEVPAYGDRPEDRYDGEIQFTDLHVGRLLAHLRARSLLETTVVAITSDHGEAFGEHGYRYHGADLHEHQIRVPLLLFVPGLRARDHRYPVSLMDLPRTLLELTGLPQPEELQGLSLVPWLASGAPPPERAIFTEMPDGPLNSVRRAIVHGRYKLIHDLETNVLRIHDVVADPAERHDLARASPALRVRLRQIYEAFVALRLHTREPTGKK